MMELLSMATVKHLESNSQMKENAGLSCLKRTVWTSLLVLRLKV